MKDDKLNTLFKKYQHDFDVEAPNSGHENRFLEKLKAQKNSKLQIEADARRRRREENKKFLEQFKKKN